MQSIQAGTEPKELSDADIENVLKTIDIPSCPALVTEVMTEAQKDDPDIGKLVKAISGDPGMSAVVLKLVNSPLFRVGSPITNIRAALERVGMRNAVSIVVAAALRSTMGNIAPSFIESFWEKTSMTALAAGLVARRQYGVSPDAAYTYALFHDIGIPLMMKRFPEYADLLEKCRQNDEMLFVAEGRYFPCTHPVIGFLMTKGWGLPHIIGEAIRYHHDEDVYDLPDRTLPGAALSLIATTQIAERLSNEMLGLEDLEVGDGLFEHALAHFGINEDDLAQMREDLEATISTGGR